MPFIDDLPFEGVPEPAGRPSADGVGESAVRTDGHDAAPRRSIANLIHGAETRVDGIRPAGWSGSGRRGLARSLDLRASLAPSGSVTVAGPHRNESANAVPRCQRIRDPRQRAVIGAHGLEEDS